MKLTNRTNKKGKIFCAISNLLIQYIFYIYYYICRARGCVHYYIREMRYGGSYNAILISYNETGISYNDIRISYNEMKFVSWQTENNYLEIVRLVSFYCLSLSTV